MGYLIIAGLCFFLGLYAGNKGLRSRVNRATHNAMWYLNKEYRRKEK